MKSRHNDMARRQRVSKISEDRLQLRQFCGTTENRDRFKGKEFNDTKNRDSDKDELVKHMLNPPRYLRRTQNCQGKALSFGVLDYERLERWKNCEGRIKGKVYSDAASSSGIISSSDQETAAFTSLSRSSSISADSHCYGEETHSSHNSKHFLESESVCRSSSDSLNRNYDLQARLVKRSGLDHKLGPRIGNRQNEIAIDVNKKMIDKNKESVSIRMHLQKSSKTEELNRTHPPKDIVLLRPNKCVLNNHKEENRESEDKNPAELDMNGNQNCIEMETRRFSFSFSQIGRSFSLKESSSALSSSSPPHVSTKSGPLISNGHNRTRSSPLRRINKSPEKENPKIRALLQFTERKGVRLFQFVVENDNSSVLAATMKEKSSDSSKQVYTFYSVKEIKKKKKSGWLGQGIKETNHGFAYKIIGHTRITTSFDMKSEAVLFDAESRPEEEEEEEAEVAAIVDGGVSCSTDIILPGGPHTPPKDGNALFPLIDRWKYGGRCDCGGWDIGCKLRVLSDRQSLHFSKGSKPHLNNNGDNTVRFFDQECEKETLKMVSHEEDGVHSVEFDSSISLLQAFFISLTLTTRRKPSAEEAPVTGRCPVKTKPPVKYASFPPVSPVGRV